MTSPADDPTSTLEPDEGEDRDTPDPEQDDGDSGADDDPVRSVKAEARSLRRRLREAEQERDALTEVVTRYRRQEAEELAAAHLADGSDLWHAATTLGDLLDDDGQVDRDKVNEAAAKLVEARPHWGRARGPRPDLSQGSTSRSGAEPADHDWQRLLRS